jgi:ABC-type glycerol-3-phosphate transport system substrate-binding protein
MKIHSRLLKKSLTLTIAVLTVTGLTFFSAPAKAATPVTISVALFTPPPPAAMLAQFTKDTGITVKWTNLNWDALQTKIAAAATANTYFADATDVDWSRVGQLGKLNWFLPLEGYLDTKSMAKDMPQLPSFTYSGHVVGIPFDASFMVTTINKNAFTKAGITTMPTTIDAFTKDLQFIKQKGVMQYPLSIPFAAAEGLSTYWYQTTGAFGGHILDKNGKPLFSTPDTPGYKAATWMVNAIKTGLVPPGNINVTDANGEQTLMAKGKVASIYSDYSGSVGTLYNVPASSSVVGQVTYLNTPGVNGIGANLGNPDGIGIPKQAKNPKAAATFIKWFTDTQNQADFDGASGTDRTWAGGSFPSRVSSMNILNSKAKVVYGDVLTGMLKAHAAPVFPQGAPAWYPQFSNAVYTNLHAAAVGTETVAAAIKAISDTATKLSNGG